MFPVLQNFPVFPCSPQFEIFVPLFPWNKCPFCTCSQNPWKGLKYNISLTTSSSIWQSTSSGLGGLGAYCCHCEGSILLISNWFCKHEAQSYQIYNLLVCPSFVCKSSMHSSFILWSIVLSLRNFTFSIWRFGPRPLFFQNHFSGFFWYVWEIDNITWLNDLRKSICMRIFRLLTFKN